MAQGNPNMHISREMVEEFVRLENARLALPRAPRPPFLTRKDVAFSADRQKDGTWTVQLGGQMPTATGLADWHAVEDFILEMMTE